MRKKIAILVISAGAVVLAVMFATPIFIGARPMVDIEVSGDSETMVLTARATLPADGTDVVCTLASRRDVIINTWFTDNTPTTSGSTRFDLVSIKIAGSDYRAGTCSLANECTNIGGNRLEMRDMDRVLSSFKSNPPPVHGPHTPIPLQAGKDFEFTLDASDETNIVLVDVILGIQSAGGVATLTCE